MVAKILPLTRKAGWPMCAPSAASAMPSAIRRKSSAFMAGGALMFLIASRSRCGGRHREHARFGEPLAIDSLPLLVDPGHLPQVVNVVQGVGRAHQQIRQLARFDGAELLQSAGRDRAVSSGRPD